jgi:hypothetical protein
VAVALVAAVAVTAAAAAAVAPVALAPAGRRSPETAIDFAPVAPVRRGQTFFRRSIPVTAQGDLLEQIVQG